MTPPSRAGLISPATRAFFRAAMARKDLPFFSRLLEALHGYIYLRAPVFYIGTALGRGPGSRRIRPFINRLGRSFGLWNENSGKSFADSYHGKVIPAADLTRLIRVGRSLELQVPEHILPYSAARDLILQNPEDLAVLDCPCRASMPKPCLPLDVCLIVGRTFVDFVLTHHPSKSRHIGAEEAVRIVADSLKRGHVTHAFFKEAVLGRFYAVCNCCPCCCGAMQAQRDGVPMLVSSGFLAVADPQTCNGCGRCVRKCPFKAITFTNVAGRPSPDIAPALCMGCGVCVAQCPTNSLRLERDPPLPAPLLDILKG